MEKLRIWFRDIKSGFESLFTWLPVIWGDHQWDHIYICYILRKKFRLMEKFYEEGNTFATTAPRTLREIKTCRILLDRIIRDDYLPDSFLAEKRGKKHKRMVDHAEMQEKQDVELLFKLMTKHLRTWWD
jgi:hypothetical protein